MKTLTKLFFGTFFAATVCAVGCGKKEGQKDVSTLSATSSEIVLAVKDSTTYYFMGELQDQAKSRTINVQGDLTFNGSTVEGKYHYNSGSGILELKGKAAADGIVSIEEQTSQGEFGYKYDPSDKPKTTAVIRGKLDRRQGLITGTWVSADGKTSYPCTMKMIAEYKKIKHPALVVSVSYPAFASSDFAVLNDSLKRTMTASYDSSVKSVQSQIDEIKSDTSWKPDFNPIERLSETDDLDVFHVSPSLVSMTHLAYMDGGGMHGNYAYHGETWKKNGTAWERVRLRELFTADTAYYKVVSDLLITALKKRDATFVVDGTVKDFRDGLRKGDLSWAIRPAGITFVFSPYEVASYAEGALEVFLPWKVLGSYIRRDGVLKELMQ